MIVSKCRRQSRWHLLKCHRDSQYNSQCKFHMWIHMGIYYWDSLLGFTIWLHTGFRIEKDHIEQYREYTLDQTLPQLGCDFATRNTKRSRHISVTTRHIKHLSCHKSYEPAHWSEPALWRPRQKVDEWLNGICSNAIELTMTFRRSSQMFLCGRMITLIERLFERASIVALSEKNGLPRRFVLRIC